MLLFYQLSCSCKFLESEKVEKAFGNLASSLVDEAISMALRSLALDDEFLDSEEQEPIEPNEDDMDNDALEPKVMVCILPV